MGVCSDWVTVEDLPRPLLDQEPSETTLSLAMRMASDALFDLTGRRWPGVCDDYVRPCSQRTSVHWPTTTYAAGERGYLCGCTSADVCGCNALSRVELAWPVLDVEEVKIDGAVVDPSEYTIVDARWLVGLGDPLRQWPCCQKIELDDDQPDTFSVTYSYGAEPPAGGVVAASSLAMQLALAIDSTLSGKCALPKGTTNVTRKNIAVAVKDPAALFPNGQTGIYEVDFWIMTVREGDKRQPAAAWVPDTTSTTPARRRPWSPTPPGS